MSGTHLDSKRPSRLTFLACLLAALALSLGLATPAFANSAEPPSLTIIVYGAPDDLELTLLVSDGSEAWAVPLIRSSRAWETYYRFYRYDLRSFDGGGPEMQSLMTATLVVRSRVNSYEIELPPETMYSYNSLMTLDYQSQTIKFGQTPGREALLVAMRVALTLVIEGLVFLAFGYRARASWIAFVVVNLITQSVLNSFFTGVNMSLSGMWVFFYLFFEGAVFTIEMITFAIVLKEQKRSRAVVYALVANTCSLIIGGALITLLPV